MRVLSMDQSTRCSGYACFEDGKYIESDIVDMSKSKLETDKRSFEMAKELLSKGAKKDTIIQKVFQSNPYNYYKLLGEALKWQYFVAMFMVASGIFVTNR